MLANLYALIYQILLIIHVLSAIIFVGYLFFAVFIVGRLKRYLSSEEFDSFKSRLDAKASVYMPPCMIALAISGGLMAHEYLNKAAGYLSSAFQMVLVLKILLALCALVAEFAYFKAVCKKQPNRLQNLHAYALALCVAVIIIAKLMFVI